MFGPARMRWVPAFCLVAAFIAAHVYAVVSDNAALGEILLDGTFLPIAVASFLYGMRGAVVATVLAVAITVSVFLATGNFQAHTFGADIALFALLAGILGRAVDKVRAQARNMNETLEAAVAERTSELQQRTRDLERLALELDLARTENLQRLALAGEFRDDQTAEHTERVGELTGLLAAELGLPRLEVDVIRQAAPLHDIGKIGTPDAILLKPGALTPAERAEMQLHTTVGAALLAGSRTPVLDTAAEIALSHHEWWDGSGYPNRIAADQIPVAARIVALADVFDALTHTRPYKDAYPVAEAITELQRLSGRQFDPAVVVAFDRLHAREALPAEAVDTADQPTRRWGRAASTSLHRLAVSA